MIKIELQVPENSNPALFDYALYLASKLYQDGIMSAGQASEVAGISKRTFIEILGKYGVSVFSENIFDLQKDIANA